MLMADISSFRLLPLVEALRNLLSWMDAAAQTSIRACHKDRWVGWNDHTCKLSSLTRGRRGCQGEDRSTLSSIHSSIQSKRERNLDAIMPPLQLWLISASWACASLKSPPDMKHVANWYLNFSISETQPVHRREGVVLISSKDFMLFLCSVNSHKWFMDLLYPLDVP